MSGIVGVWNGDGEPVRRSLLESLSARLAHRGPDGEGQWVQGPVGLACRLLRVTPEAAKEVQPLQDGFGSVLVFDGRLDNREDLLACLPQSQDLAADSPDPALVLAAYRAFGDRFPEQLAGDFALGLFDPGRQQFLLARDAIGIRPLYYCRTGSTLLFASEIKAILAHPRVSIRPNDDVLADYLLGGSRNSQGMTCFVGILSLPPAHMAIASPNELTVRRYWDFDPSLTICLGSFEEYAHAFRDHFARAIRRRIRSASPVAVSVSGGLDSSSILCLAETMRGESSGLSPRILGLSCTSPDGDPSDEKVFLLEIERQYRLTIERLPTDAMGLMDGSTEAVRHIEAPFLDEQWTTNQRLLQTARQHGARVMLTGHWADQMLFDQTYLIDLFRRFAWTTIRAHLREYGRWLTDADPRYFRQRFVLDLVKHHVPAAVLPYLHRLRPKNRSHTWYTEAFRQGARRAASRQMPIRTVFPSRHSRALYEEMRAPHHVICMEWNNKEAAMHGLEMAFPFLDRDLLSFLLAIPYEAYAWRGVPKALLREGMSGVLPDAIRNRTWKADFTHLVNEGMERDHAQLVEYLQGNGMAVQLGYLKPDVVRTAVARLKGHFRGSTAELAWSLSDLLGLELWLQTFFGGSAQRHGANALSEPRLGLTTAGGLS